MQTDIVQMHVLVCWNTNGEQIHRNHEVKIRFYMYKYVEYRMNTAKMKYVVHDWYVHYSPT